MMFENEILNAIMGMSLGFGLWFALTYVIMRIDDWWKEMS